MTQRVAYIHPEEVEDFLEQVRAHVGLEVTLGFATGETIVDAVMESVGLEEYAEDLRDQLREIRCRVVEIVREEVTRNDAEQQTWPGITDCDRLDAAFSQLQEDRILAAQRFGSDAEAGREQVRAYIDALPESEKPEGFVFLDDEGIWDCFRTRILKLNFGAVGTDPQRAREVGEVIGARMRENGLRPDWNGEPEGALRALNFVWRRRRPVKA